MFLRTCLAVALFISGLDYSPDYVEACRAAPRPPRVVVRGPRQGPRPNPHPKPRPTHPPGPRPTRNPRAGHTKRPAPQRPSPTVQPAPQQDKLDSIDSIQVLNEQRKTEARIQGDSISLASSNDLNLAPKKPNKYPTVENLPDADAAPSAPPKSPTISLDLTTPKKTSKTKQNLKNAGIYFGVSTGSGLISSAPFLALQAVQDANAAEVLPAGAIAQRPNLQQPTLPQYPGPQWPNNAPPLPKHGQPQNLPPSGATQTKVLNTEKTGRVIVNQVKKKPKVIVKPTPATTAVAVPSQRPPVTPLPRVNVLNPLPRFQQILPACNAHPLRCAVIGSVITAFSTAGVTVGIQDIVTLDPDSPTAMMKWMEQKLIDLARHLGVPRDKLEITLEKFPPKLLMAHIFTHTIQSVQAFRKRHNMPLQFEYPEHYRKLGLSRVQHILLILTKQGPELYDYISETLKDMERLEPELFDYPAE